MSRFETPVVFIIFNRADYAQKVFDEIAKAKPAKLLVIADGPRSEAEAKRCNEARAIVETLPLAKEHLMDHQYIPVGPLMPLRALNPGAFQ